MRRDENARLAPAPGALHRRLAAELREAAQEHTPVVPISSRYPGLTLADAYEIQRATLAMERASGARIVGRKIGATSAAIRQMFGIDHPDAGFITDGMVYPSGATLDARAFIAPRVEGELAFRLGCDLSGPDVTRDDVLDAVVAVHPVLEVLDSRICDWAIKLVDTVADNASCGTVILGDPVALPDLDLAAERMCLTVDGVSHESHGDAVMGHPAEPVAWLARMLWTQGELLPAGSIVLAGAWVVAVELVAGSVARASFDSCGSVSLTVRS